MYAIARTTTKRWRQKLWPPTAVCAFIALCQLFLILFNLSFYWICFVCLFFFFCEQKQFKNYTFITTIIVNSIDSEQNTKTVNLYRRFTSNFFRTHIKYYDSNVLRSANTCYWLHIYTATSAFLEFFNGPHHHNSE